MLFETEKQALEWYESEERVLTPAFIEALPWDQVRETAVKKVLVPILRYMRDVENFTTIYYEELVSGPTGKNPYIKRFMDRWKSEEPTHAALLHRFLHEAGFEDTTDVPAATPQDVPFGKKLVKPIKSLFTKLFGDHFGAVHMVWGAINEQCTLIGYKRLWERADHPVLEEILRAIVREEARHAFFYWSVARIHLLRAPFTRRLSRFVINRFWSPVGQGMKPKDEINHVIRFLFPDKDGVQFFHQHVNERIARLPGFAKLVRVTDRVAEVVPGRRYDALLRS